MTTLTSRSIALFVASLTIGATLPFAAAESMKALYNGGNIMGIDGTAVQLHRAYTTRDRADYNRAIDIYNVYLQDGKTGLVKPDINVRASIDFYLNNPGTGRVAVPPPSTVPLSTDEYVKPDVDVSPMDVLSQQERAALARSEKVGKCWQYPGFSKGYYALCLQRIEGKAKLNTTGLQNDLIHARTTGRSALTSSSRSKVTIPSTPKDYVFPVMTKITPRNMRTGSSSSK